MSEWQTTGSPSKVIPTFNFTKLHFSITRRCQHKCWSLSNNYILEMLSFLPPSVFTMSFIESHYKFKNYSNSIVNIPSIVSPLNQKVWCFRMNIWDIWVFPALYFDSRMDCWKVYLSHTFWILHDSFQVEVRLVRKDKSVQHIPQTTAAYGQRAASYRGCHQKGRRTRSLWTASGGVITESLLLIPYFAFESK